MAEYVYEGAAPEVGPDGELARPLDVREFDKPPDWGLWQCLQPEPTPPPPVTPPAPPPAPVATPPVTAPDAKGGM